MLGGASGWVAAGWVVEVEVEEAAMRRAKEVVRPARLEVGVLVVVVLLLLLAGVVVEEMRARFVGVSAATASSSSASSSSVPVGMASLFRLCTLCGVTTSRSSTPSRNVSSFLYTVGLHGGPPVLALPLPPVFLGGSLKGSRSRLTAISAQA